MNTLIVGGTSGLGLELAKVMAVEGEKPIITGRHNPEVDFAEYQEFDLSADNLPERVGQFVTGLPPIKTLVYAAGFYQEGRITDLRDEQIDEMIDVGGRGLIFFVKKLLEKQGELPELVTITSTSQWTPREYEPVYNFVKAGAGHYSHGQSLDPRIDKTRVIGVSGMATEFWSGTDKDTSNMLQPEWVARQITQLLDRDEEYIFARVLGATSDLPKRVEIEGKTSVAADATVGQLLRIHRNHLGLSQKDAAELIGVSRQYYSSLESGISLNTDYKNKQWRPRAKTLIRVARALDMDETCLLIAGGYAI